MDWILVHVQNVMLVMKDAGCTVMISIREYVWLLVDLTTAALRQDTSFSHEVEIHWIWEKNT